MILKIKNRKIIIYVLLVLISFIICQNYLKMHYAVDTYAMINMGYKNYATKYFLKDGRVFSFLITFLAGKINLPIEVFVRISTLIGIFVSCLSVMLIRKIMITEKLPKNIWQEIIITGIAYCTIFNFMYIEVLHFAEASILATRNLF